MFRRDTVLIVGAGASHEVGMPLGARLAEQISALANVSGRGDGTEEEQDLVAAMREKYGANWGPQLATLKQVAAGVLTANSIDSYIYRHSAAADVSDIAKLLIAYFILAAERVSRLNERTTTHDRLRISDFHDTWLFPFARLLFDGVRATEAEQLGSGLTIICFNYDRCIERFLLDAIAEGYHVDPYTAHNLVRGIRILRPYGSLGELPSPTGLSPHALRYGDVIAPAAYWGVAQRIRTFSEQFDEGSVVLEEMRAALKSASQIIYLGFSFLPQNMRLLQVDRPGGMHKVFATGWGVSEQERKIVSEMIGQKAISVDLELNTKCVRMLELHGRNISARLE